MKVTVDIDCTPEEARTFFGLPDVKPAQDAFMREVEQRVRDGVKGMDVDAMMRAWMESLDLSKGAMQGFEAMQKAFWSRFSGADRGGGGS